MKNLYEFLMELYNVGTFKIEMSFDEFIEGFLNGTLGVSAVHEGFYFEDFIINFKMCYKVDHNNRKIELFFEKMQ